MEIAIRGLFQFFRFSQLLHQLLKQIFQLRCQIYLALDFIAPTKEQTGWSGGAIAPAYDGRPARRRYTIGPLTREHAAGGLRVLDLFPVTSTPETRPLVVLSDEADDGELGRDPIAFRVDALRVMQFSLYLDVIEADVVV